MGAEKKSVPLSRIYLFTNHLFYDPGETVETVFSGAPIVVVVKRVQVPVRRRLSSFGQFLSRISNSASTMVRRVG